MEVMVGKGLSVIDAYVYKTGSTQLLPDYHEIAGYKVGKYDFYLVRNEVKQVPWERGDVLNAFALGFLHHSLRENMREIRSDGFFSSDDVANCVCGMSGLNSEMITDFLGRGPVIVSVKRHSFTSPIEVELLDGNSNLSLTRWSVEPKSRKTA
jgi:hypothetical protein